MWHSVDKIVSCFGITPLIVFCLIMVKKRISLFFFILTRVSIYIDFLLKFTNCAIAIPFIFSARLIRFCVYCRTITLLPGQKHILHLLGGSNPYINMLVALFCHWEFACVLKKKGS